MDGYQFARHKSCIDQADVTETGTGAGHGVEHIRRVKHLAIMADGGWRMADGGWRMADGGHFDNFHALGVEPPASRRGWLSGRARGRSAEGRPSPSWIVRSPPGGRDTPEKASL